MKKKYVLIDCDPGHDDVMAILSTIAHPDIFHILGITTVCGNHGEYVKRSPLYP